MQEPFVGTWKLNHERSKFDANHHPGSGSMVFELNSEGHYLMIAKGTDQNGKAVAERPQTLIPDGAGHPLPDFHGLMCVTTRPDPNTLRSEVRREDGSIVGEGSYVVAADGKSLTATVAGFDTQLRRFENQTVWDRE